MGNALARKTNFARVLGQTEKVDMMRRRRNCWPIRYYIEAEPLVGDYVAKKEDYDLLSVVMIYLDRNCDEIEDDLLGFLDVLFSSDRSLDEKRDILEKRYGVPMTEEMELEVQDMGSVGIGLLEEGYERGIERGLVQGEEREESRFARLTELLEHQDRIQDILRAAKEPKFKISLYQEFHIE